MLKDLNKTKFQRKGRHMWYNCFKNWKIYAKKSKLTGIALEMSSYVQNLCAINAKFQLKPQNKL